MRSCSTEVRIDRDPVFSLVRHSHARAQVGARKLLKTPDQLLELGAGRIFNGQLEPILAGGRDPLLAGDATVSHLNSLGPGHHFYFCRTVLPEFFKDRFEVRFQIVFYASACRNDNPETVVVADLLGTYPPGAL